MESYNNNDPDKNGLLRKGRLRDEESRFQTSLVAVLVSPLSLSSRYLSRREDLAEEEEQARSPVPLKGILPSSESTSLTLTLTMRRVAVSSKRWVIVVERRFADRSIILIFLLPLLGYLNFQIFTFPGCKCELIAVEWDTSDGLSTRRNYGTSGKVRLYVTGISWQGFFSSNCIARCVRPLDKGAWTILGDLCTGATFTGARKLEEF